MPGVRLAVAAFTALVLITAISPAAGGRQSAFDVREYRVPAGSHPHDVAPARDGGRADALTPTGAETGPRMRLFVMES